MISVVIPTHNRATLLLRAVESVLAQSFRDLELIVVDDGSTDRTGEELSAVEDPRLRCLKQPHRGVSAARNAGIRAARYPLVAFLDSDDSWYEKKLEQQFAALEQWPEFQWVHTNEIWIRKGIRVNQGQRHRKSGGWIYDRCLPLCVVSPSSVMIRRALFARKGLFDETFPVCEDYDLWLRLAAQYPILYLDDPLVQKYGGHADQLSQSLWGLDRFRIRALIKMIESGILTSQQLIWTYEELAVKSRILIGGWIKRGKTAEMSNLKERMRDLMSRNTNIMSHLCDDAREFFALG
jgi:glycosyltransferase involved in cell wall biosynthesis